MWLGHPDPATALLEQIRHDPDSEALTTLLTEWRRAFSATPMTVRKVVERAESGSCPDLLDAILEFPVGERDSINRSKLGWFLKKSDGRIVGGYHFQRTLADGRTAWRVVAVDAPPSPPLPPSTNASARTVAADLDDLEI